ncbi:MAG TPA: organomercurial lyase [Chloroflexota bacterium]
MAAHGFSLVPARQHRLAMRGRQFWTWCAIDAVGIPAGLGEDAGRAEWRDLRAGGDSTCACGDCLGGEAGA